MALNVDNQELSALLAQNIKTAGESCLWVGIKQEYKTKCG